MKISIRNESRKPFELKFVVLGPYDNIIHYIEAARVISKIVIFDANRKELGSVYHRDIVTKTFLASYKGKIIETIDRVFRFNLKTKVVGLNSKFWIDSYGADEVYNMYDANNKIVATITRQIGWEADLEISNPEYLYYILAIHFSYLFIQGIAPIKVYEF